jgi:Flp pilus assembly protein CpaB
LFWSAKDVAQGFFKDFNRGIVANVFSKILGKITKDTFKEELPEITSEVNEALAQMVLKIIEDGQRAKALTTQASSLQQLSPEALAQILGR